MANRKEICTAGLLLLLSLLQTTQSASITAAVTKQMASLGEKALAYLNLSTASALRSHRGSHSAGCITEPKENERLDCSLISTFSSYLQAASHLDELNDTLHQKLLDIIEPVESLNAKCRRCSTNICEPIFQDEKPYKNLEKLRSLLELYLQWIVRPMEFC